MSLPEVELIGLAQQGDKTSLNKFFKEIQPMLIKMALTNLKNLGQGGTDLEDVIQNINLKVFKYLKRLTNLNAFRSWLSTIVRNEVIDYIRHRICKIEKCNISLDELRTTGLDESDEASLYDMLPAKDDIEKELEFREFELEVMEKVSQDMLPQFKDVFLLREQNGQDYHSIGTILGIPIGTVKSRLARARKYIRSTIKEFPSYA